MDDMEVNLAYGKVERMRTLAEGNIYELPEILSSETKKEWSPQEGKGKNKSKTGHRFNIFITLFGVFTFLLILTFLIFFLVTYSSNQPLEIQQSTDIEAIKSLFNESNKQIRVLENYIEGLEQQLNSANVEIKQLIFDRQCQLQQLRPENVSGLRKIADINMTDPTQQCPNGFELISRTEPPLRTCGRPINTTGCVSVIFPVHGNTYTYVFGRVVGYQIGSPSGIYYIGSSPLISSIDSHYVAGISLTYGQPRHHIWSFANARGEGFGTEVCPCVSGSSDGIVPQFVGNDYFCDSAIRGTNVTDGVFYPNDPLWDGQGCGSTSTCCEFNNPPWFCKQLPQPTTDDIELRLCENSFVSDDDSPLEMVELYIN